MDISKTKMQFFKKLQIDIDKLPKEFDKYSNSYNTNFSNEEKEFLYSNSYTGTFMMPFSMKDICGTMHPSYESMTFLEAFIKGKREDKNIELFYKNPDYYFVSLKNPNQSQSLHDTPIELVRDYEGKCFIKGGNNRLNLLMMLYLAEMSNAKTEEEKENTNKKYTFYGEVRSLPKNKEVLDVIFMLKEYYEDNIDFKFIGNNPDDIKYEITLDGKSTVVNSFNELEKILEEAYSIKYINNCQKLYQKLTKIVYDYNSYALDNNKINILKRICPNIQSLAKKFIDLRVLTNASSDVFKNYDFSQIDYLVVEKFIDSTLEEIKKKKTDDDIKLVLNAFKNCKSKNDIKEAIDYINKVKNRVDISAILPNYEKFIVYFEESYSVLPDEVYDNYEDAYNFILNTVFMKREKELESLEEKEQILLSKNVKIDSYIKALSNQDYFQTLKEKNLNYGLNIEKLSSQNVKINEHQLSKREKHRGLVDDLVKLEQKNRLVRFFNRRKIGKLKMQISTIEDSISYSESDINEITKRVNEIKDEKSGNQENLYNLYGSKITFEEYEELLSTAKTFDIKNLIKDQIEIKEQIINLGIDKKKKELEQIKAEIKSSVRTR